MSVHTWFRPGQRILIILKTGEHIVSRFIECKSRGKCKALITRKGIYRAADIRSSSIYRADADRQHHKEKQHGNPTRSKK